MIRFALVIAACFGLLALLFELAGVSGVEIAKSFIEGCSGYSFAAQEFIGWGPVAEILRRMAPLVITGLAVFIALQAGLFNIGAEGQLRVGGIAAAAVALYLGLPGPLATVAAIALGCAAGFLWALPAALIKVYRGGHEVISTIMLNNIAAHLTTFLIGGPMRAPQGEEAATDMIPASARVPIVGTEGQTLVIYPALLIGILLCALCAWFLTNTVRGYELRASGANTVAATFAGIHVKSVLLWSMAGSGAIAGLAGALHLLGQEGRYTEGFSPGFGFDSLGVALLAGKNPLGVIPAAMLFASIDQGAIRAQVAHGLPKEISAVIQGLLILIVALLRYRRRVGQ